ncbi:MAG: tRNA lysidine(34) synthetase TilS [Paludibacteraceae bacterium]|nr:tRNA lysidine(34) synthetase TilS [Paludibacteraceae bacterium]
MQEQLMPCTDTKLLVAVSGGIDSVVLLDVLVHLGYKCVVAHCNFHLRGQESDDDMTFVAQLAAHYQVPLQTIHFDTTNIAQERKISIEMAARELRYTWFKELLKSEQCGAVAIAHHANDAVETFFVNLARGTGIRGLLGIQATNEFIIRPLLHCKRSQIETYAREHGLNFRTDSTNNETVYVRNKIRHQIIPPFQEINPSFTDTMCRNIENLSDVAEIYSYFIKDLRTKLCHEEKGITQISIEQLQVLPAFKTILFELLQPYNFNSATVDSIIQSLDGLSGKEFYSTTHRVIINRTLLEIEAINVIDNDVYTIDNGSCAITNPIELTFERVDGIPEIKKDKQCAYLDADKVIFPLVLRHWQQGDSFVPFGMKQSKKVSDFFIDEKISRSLKDKLWILTSQNDIIWIVGQRIDNRFRVSNETKSTLIINYKE